MQDPRAEERRLRALLALEIITSGPDPVMDQICALASDMFDVPVALVTLLDEKHQWFKATCGLDADRMPREQAFCNHTILSDEVLVVPDARSDDRFASNPFVTGAPHVCFYAGAPLRLEPGIRPGALCIIDSKPRSFTARDQHRLAQLALLVEAQIRLHSANLGLKRQAELMERKQHELVWAATHDRLTGLPNRTLFQDELQRAIRAAKGQGTGVGVLLVDLDEFKHVNHTLGHDAGDALLGAVATRLSSTATRPDLVARLGGDEFGVLIPNVQDVAELQAASARVIAALREPVHHQGHSVRALASIGQTRFPQDGQSAAELLKSADLALHAAKGEGGNRAVAFRADLRNGFLARMAALDRARDALRRDAVVPYYQPKVCLRSGRVMGFEALLRWYDPILGLQSPATIQDAFSDPVLSIELGRRMLDQVLADMATWTQEGVPFGSVAVNVAAGEFACGNLCTRILDRLAELHLPASALQLEVTEGVSLGSGSGEVTKALRGISDRGVAVALDDFGTGFASLTHLRQLPVQWLKIDQSFVGDVTASEEAAAIVHTIIGLAQSLGLGLVAEGVETVEQLEFLRRRGCDLGQGYLFSKPMPAGRVRSFLAGWDRHARPVSLRLVS